MLSRMKLQEVEPHQVRSIYGMSFSKGLRYSNWRPDGSGDCLLLYTLNGGGLVGNRQTQKKTAPSDLVLFEMHAEQVYMTDPEIGRWEFLWCHYLPRPAWSFGKTWPAIAPGVRLLPIPIGSAQRAVQGAMSDLIASTRKQSLLGDQFALNALECVLLHAESEAQMFGQPILDPRIRKAIDFLTLHIDRPFNLAQTAKHAGLSVSRLSHLFRNQVGQPPRVYAEEQKLRQAAQLLRLTAMSIEEVGRACGFENAFYFSNRFRKWALVSPSGFRKQDGRKRAKIC